MKKWLFLLAACSSTPAPAPQQPSQGVVKDTRTPLEQRRDAACDIVGKRTAACAVEDSDKLYAAGKISEDAHKKATEHAVVVKDAEVYADKCKAKRDYSSRQIRVLEMCPKYETECEPFLACLQNLQPQSK
jgi:hypothetical protein